MSCSADYYLLTCSQRRLVGADVWSARTSRRYQNRKCSAPSQFGIVGAVNWQRRLVRAEHTSAHTITTVTHSQRRIVGAANVTKVNFRTFFMVRVGAHKRIVGATRNTQHLLLFAANTIIFCFTSGTINNCSYKMAAH